MTDDVELLRRYAEESSEEAFAELVRRHVNFVYAAALRQARHAHRAEDVVQLVFTDLARKARALCQRREIVGWLYLSTHHAAAGIVRHEVRREAREQEAQVRQELATEPAGDPAWERIAPVLDAALHELGEADRDAILLRFFKDRPFADVGEALGVTEDAAKKRVQRALDKLRPILARRGVTSTAAGLAFVLTHQTAVAAPAELAASVTTVALQSAAAGAAGAGLLAGWWQLLAAGKGAVVAALVVLAGFAIFRGVNGPAEPVLTKVPPAGTMVQATRASPTAAPSATAVNTPTYTASAAPAPTLAEILAEPDELRAVSLYARHLLQLPAGDFEAVFARILTVVKPEQKLSFLNLLLQRWGQVDPRSAMEHLTTLQGQPIGGGVITAAQMMQYKNAVMDGWATMQPVEALNWVVQNPGDFAWAADLAIKALVPSLATNVTTQDGQIGFYQRLRITEMIGALAANGQYPEAAAMLVRAPLDPTNPLEIETTKSLMAAWVSADGAAAAAWLPVDFSAGPLRKAAYTGFVQSVADAAPDVATRFVQSLNERDDIEAAGSGVIASFRSRADAAGGYEWLRDNMGDNSNGAYDNAVYELFGFVRNKGYGTGVEGEAARSVIAGVRDGTTRKRAAGTYARYGAGSPEEAIRTVLQFYSEEERWTGVSVPASTMRPGMNGLMMLAEPLPTIVSQWAKKDRAATVASVNGLTSLPEPDQARLRTAIDAK